MVKLKRTRDDCYAQWFKLHRLYKGLNDKYTREYKEIS